MTLTLTPPGPTHPLECHVLFEWPQSVMMKLECYLFRHKSAGNDAIFSRGQSNPNVALTAVGPVRETPLVWVNEHQTRIATLSTTTTIKTATASISTSVLTNNSIINNSKNIECINSNINNKNINNDDTDTHDPLVTSIVLSYSNKYSNYNNNNNDNSNDNCDNCICELSLTA